MNKRQLGAKWEKIAKEYLESIGYVILEVNFRCRLGEIDIIARHKSAIVFIEVKYRSTNQYGASIEAVNYRKQNTIRRVANYYLITTLHSTNIPCRFDVLGIDGKKITLIKDAF